MSTGNDQDMASILQESVQAAYQAGDRLSIEGAGTKSFYGNPVNANPLDVKSHKGIVEYEPSELVLTARCGTRLSDIEMVLADAGQMLAFEPPAFGPNATLGGCVATGLSGPRRPYSGSVRDAMLGSQVINGRGELMNFGGKVIKNVAGYDVSRLMTGAMGTLGVLLQVSMKVMPRPQVEVTVCKSCTASQAIEEMNQLSARPIALSGAAYVDGHMYLRFSGNEAAVFAAQKSLGHDGLPDNTRFWQALNEQIHPFFNKASSLWRLSVSPGSTLPDLQGEWFLDWGGAQRWLASAESPHRIREAATQAGGHATLFRTADSMQAKSNHGVFHPLPAALADLNRKIKHAFDPKHILNPGKFYPETD